MHRLLILIVLGLAGCGHLGSPPASPTIARLPTPPTEARLPADSRAHDVVMFALGLVDTDYRFGGKNPAAGLDCSGMVSYVFGNAAGLNLAGSAADMARSGQRVGGNGLRPGDLVFFNTRNRPRSHVGIYIGDGRFVHAPNSNGKVRTESLTQGWFATRFEEARTYFD
ncbi:MAG: C40 family peptidase [Rhodocyclaceae bacterium]|nr:C40 family peptidase [Rhodocyclaceae bacterium]MDP3031920.1 C40 family peptidase [Rhodocyclaceae bacterium]